jgi:hypothetical protein
VAADQAIACRGRCGEGAAPAGAITTIGVKDRPRIRIVQLRLDGLSVNAVAERLGNQDTRSAARLRRLYTARLRLLLRPFSVRAPLAAAPSTIELGLFRHLVHRLRRLIRAAMVADIGDITVPLFLDGPGPV